MNIQDYINDYDFNTGLSKFKENFTERKVVKNYLEKNPEGNFADFAKDFWEDPNRSMIKLKQKYGISQTISYSDIIKAYPTDQYVHFLKMIYSREYSIDEIISVFTITHDKVEELLVPVIITGYERYCPRSFHNCFEIEVDLYGLKDSALTYICQGCSHRYTYNDLITEEQVKVEINKITQEKSVFHEKTVKIQESLNEIKCPKCQEQLQLDVDEEKLAYLIKCKKCKYSSADIDKTIKEYEQWKQRAAMMIAIKAKEQELIETALKSKKLDDIFFKKENVIAFKESYDAFEFAVKLDEMDALEAWKVVFDKVKSCNRLEKRLLIHILELTKEQNKKIKLSVGDREAILYDYSPKDPLVFDLINKTKIIVARQILRNLIEKELIIVDEEQGYLGVLPTLVDNLDSINSLTKPQNINSHIRYMIFERQNFTCMICGGTGRELKIAYLTSDKNQNDLNSMIAICENCFDLVTKNDVLIDGTITFEADELDNDEYDSWRFLIKYLPELKNEESVHNSIVNMENQFRTSDIMKALAITIDKLRHGELTDGTINSFIRYCNGILRNAVKLGQEVRVYKNISDEFELNKWIKEENI